jgi:hypothetical protein
MTRESFGRKNQTVEQYLNFIELQEKKLEEGSVVSFAGSQSKYIGGCFQRIITGRIA